MKTMQETRRRGARGGPRWFAILAALLLTLGLGVGLAQERTSIRIGYAIAKTGPNAAGAAVTTLPNYQLWVHDVNAAGGIYLSSLGKRLPIEVVEYDDQSSSEELVRATERLINQDKVDFILPPWGTASNLAVGPLYNRAGYPQLAVTAVTDKAPELAKRWPNAFFLLGTSTEGAQTLVDMLKGMRDGGRLGNKVAMVAVSDEFGIELANAARPAFKAAGFDLVYDKNYPLGAQDLQPIMADVKRLQPDAFVAFSYPPGTIGLTEAARVLGFNPTVFYTAVGTAFPLFRDHFGAAAEGVMGIGGWDATSPAIQAYLKHHTEVTGQEPDRWASPYTYASLQMLQQAIERVGKIDRAATIKELQTGTFDTVLGPVKLENNLLTKLWWVGQWQNGEFVALAPDREGIGTPVVPKPAWPE